MRPIFERRSGMLCVLSLIHILWFPLSLFSLFPSLAASSGSWLLFPNSPSPFIILLEFPMSSSPPTPLSLPQPIVHNFPSTPSLPSSLLSDLLQASHVLVSWDAAAPPLTSVNSGLYQVLSHSPHFFTLHLGSRTDTVYVHRLKTAVMTPSTPTATLPPCCRPAAAPLPPFSDPLRPLLPPTNMFILQTIPHFRFLLPPPHCWLPSAWLPTALLPGLPTSRHSWFSSLSTVSAVLTSTASPFASLMSQSLETWGEGPCKGFTKTSVISSVSDTDPQGSA